MKNKVDDPFLYGCPILDLHGETYETSKVLTKMFIDDAIKTKDKKLVIIHGKGKGIVKEAVHNELKSSKYVKNYYTDNFNDGMTIVELK